MIFTVKGEGLKLEGLIGFLKDVGFEEQLNLFGEEEGVLSISSDMSFHRGFSYCAFKDLYFCLDVEKDAKDIYENIESIINSKDNETSTEESDDSTDNKLNYTQGIYELAGYAKELFNNSYFFADSDVIETGITRIGDEELEDLYEPEIKKGQKFNEGKLPMDIVLFRQFPKAFQAVAKCSLNGHNKYKETDQDWLNFKRVDGGSQNYADAALRHSFDKGSLNDSGLPHIFHKLWNVMAEVELYIEENNIET